MASCSKQRRVSINDAGEESDLDIDFSVSNQMKNEIGRAFAVLCLIASDKAITFRPLSILNCNGADERSGIPFSKAYCSVQQHTKLSLICDIFQKGVEMLADFVNDGTLPRSKPEKVILSRLMRFMILDAKNTIFKDIDRLKETELTTLVANHLLGKLSISGEYVIDKNSHGKRSCDSCLCGKKGCKLTGRYGDTSIGNGEVWHGSMDLILNNDVGVVEPIPEEQKQDSPGGKSQVESSQTSSELYGNPQIIAETVVFSFLQKKRHPENEHFLTPCIGVGSSEIVIYLYDAQHDVLMESSHIPLMKTISEGVVRFSLDAILASWFVVNYKYLCSGLTENMKNFVKADFFTKANKKIHIYRNELKFQDVGTSTSSSALNLEVDDEIQKSDFGSEILNKISHVL